MDPSPRSPLHLGTQLGGTLLRGATRAAGTAIDQAEALAKLPTTVLGTVEEVRGAARALRRASERADALLDEVDAPLRAVAPGLRRLADLLDDPMVAEAPDTLRRIREEVLPALRAIRETQSRMATLASSTDRLTGAAAMFMRRTTGRSAAEPALPQAGPSAAVEPDEIVIEPEPDV